MPEGDSAYRVAATLDRWLAGRTLTGFQVRTAALAGVDLAGEEVRGVEPFGKHVFIRIGDLSLHSHMLMDGVWHIYRSKARWRRPAHHARIVLTTREGQAVGFQVAQIKLLKTADEKRIVGHLGPDLLKPEWEQGGREKAIENLQADPRPIHVALLDQANLAGLGNEYANDLCFLMGTDPQAPATQVNAAGFVDLGHRLIHANKNRVERTTTGDTRPGRRLYAYGRAGQACLRCGTTIRFTRLGADPTRLRHVYWCPNCQPESGARHQAAT